jgi:trehalose 6-phosphate synthase/phosphatase
MARGDLIVVSNRLPVTVTDKSGRLVIKRSIGGLVTALGGVVRRGQSKWVGWTGLDHVVAAARLRKAGLPEGLMPVQIGPRLLKGFYENFSNRLLWPSMHGIRPSFGPTEQDWKAYQTVNQRFAEAVRRTAQPNDLIWIHDYHLLMMPQYLRDTGQTNRLGLFLHIPFPSPEYWFAMPHAREMLESLCRLDVLGLQAARDIENFNECAKIIGVKQLPALVDAFPIGINFKEYNAAETRIGVKPALRRIARNLGDKKIIFSLSRLDYTKGTVTQLLAAERFLAENPDREKYVYKLIVAPSREQVEEYRYLRATINRVVRGVNQRLGNERWKPVSYSYRNIGFEEVAAWYLSADTLLLLPEADGMNLIAKEYVATRQAPGGMLVLSESAGSAFQLRDALLVPPHDVEAAADALEKAITMQPGERSIRWERLRTNVEAEDVMWWADRFVDALAKAKIVNKP